MATMNSAQQAWADNLAGRQQLLQYGVRMNNYVGSFTLNAGSPTLTVKVPPIGVITGFDVRVTAALNISATATASPLGPYTLLQGVTFRDYNQIRHVDCTGYELYHYLSVRSGRPWMAAGQGNIDTNQTVQTTAVNANAPMSFNLYIPLASDPNQDTTGAVIGSANYADQYIDFTFANSLVNPSCWLAPYTAGTIAYVTQPTVEIWMNYIQPIQQGLLPLIDLTTVNELKGRNSSTDNIIAGGYKQVNFPDTRSVMGLYLNSFDNNGVVLNDANLQPATGFTLIVSGNMNKIQQSPRLNRQIMRTMLGGDLPSGTHYFSYRNNPIQVNQTGAAQMQVNYASASASGNSLNWMFESQYPTNVPLPGILQG